MKKLILLLVTITLFSSCLPDDDGQKISLELVPIESVEIPQEFVLGETYNITVRYFRPSDCHVYDGIYYESNLNERTFAIRNAVNNNGSCSQLNEVIVEKSFDFFVTSNGSYIFKFWQGVNNTGENVFLEYEIPVID